MIPWQWSKFQSTWSGPLTTRLFTAWDPSVTLVISSCVLKTLPLLDCLLWLSLYQHCDNVLWFFFLIFRVPRLTHSQSLLRFQQVGEAPVTWAFCWWRLGAFILKHLNQWSCCHWIRWAGNLRAFWCIFSLPSQCLSFSKSATAGIHPSGHCGGGSSPHLSEGSCR